MKKSVAILLLLVSNFYCSAQCWNNVGIGYSMLIIAQNGTLWANGYNSSGQLGDGTTVDKTDFVQIGTATNWATVAHSGETTIAIKTDGTLWAWGKNDYGQLGDNTLINRTSPVQIGTSTNWAKVFLTANTTLAIKTDNSMWSWGRNNYGQLGLGNYTNRKVPTRIGLANDWATASAGLEHFMALKTDGRLYTWGWNNEGQLGDDSLISKNIPTQIGTDLWSKIDCGHTYSYGIKANGTLWSWGRGGIYYEPLGQGSVIQNYKIPSQVGVDTDWLKIGAGAGYLKAIKTNGTLWACGFNNYGCFGMPTPSLTYDTLIQIGTDNNSVDLFCGSYNNVVIKNNGVFYACGDNMNGYLFGNSYPLQYYGTPVPILCPQALNTDEFSQHEIILYPNPTYDYLFIKNENEQEIEKIEITDITGRMLFEKVNPNFPIDIGYFNSNLYIAKITIGKVEKRLKFIKK